MLLDNRVKHHASLSGNTLVVGAVVDGFTPAQFETTPGRDKIPYLLEDAAGGFELGVLIITIELEATYLERVVQRSNKHESSFWDSEGFADDTQNLTFSIIQTAAMSVGVSSTRGGPRTYGDDAMAIGPASEALHPLSMAVGVRAATKIIGEAAFGNRHTNECAYPSWLPVKAYAEPNSSSTFLPSADEDGLVTTIFTDAMFAEPSVVRVQGTIVVSRENSESDTATQTYDISYVLTSIGRGRSVAGTPSFTPLDSSVTLPSVSFTFDANEGLTLTNTSGTTTYIAWGLLHIHWISTDAYWWN